jgi:hypothetical protein
VDKARDRYICYETQERNTKRIETLSRVYCMNSDQYARNAAEGDLGAAQEVIVTCECVLQIRQRRCVSIGRDVPTLNAGILRQQIDPDEGRV